MTASTYSDIAKRVIRIEMESLQKMSSAIGPDFDRAVSVILNGRQKLIVSGMGKSGIIGKKMAATFSSTGTQSFFVHPGEAFHGDLGMIGKEDVVVLLSYSGETEEVLQIIPFLKWQGNTIISMTGNPSSTMAKHADIHLHIDITEEACPLQLAPTSSTTATLVLGDALAVALMEARDFNPENFARFHPGGSLGRKLLATVNDFARKTNLPFISENATPHELVLKLAEGKLGLVMVQDLSGNLVGIVTDGDLRRALVQESDFKNLRLTDMMTTSPVCVSPETPLAEAEKLMLEKKITSVLVKNGNAISGVFQLYDLMKK
ncbi:MAG: KpsF/GutQ family sugar-phosphate isomerase [Bacteroidota bacterium]